MKEKTSPLFSHYIIDGVAMEETPFSALYDCLDGNGSVDVPDERFNDIVDECLDKVPHWEEYDPSLAEEYLQRILQTPGKTRTVDMNYPVCWTISAIDATLLDALFRDGHFTLQNILLIAKWDWFNAPAGNLSAFYDSTVTAGHYLFDLGVKLDRYFVEENGRCCTLDLSIASNLSSRRKCPNTMDCLESSDWIVYIPFVNTRMQLGGSALSRIVGCGGGVEPDLNDADYFQDCFEVVREMVEDGVVVAGCPIGRGGLLTAAEKFRGRKGFSLDISGLSSALGESDMIKLLFSEIPGVLIQIRDSDYDYLDSQMLLQEIAYFPLGHPDRLLKEIAVTNTGKNPICSILDSLLSQAEGED